MESKIKLLAIIAAVLLVLSVIGGCEKYTIDNPLEGKQISRFKSGGDLLDAFKEAQKRGRGGLFTTLVETEGVQEMAMASASDSAAGREYSETNIQVEGVDEADIVKTDGEYIYNIVSGGSLVISKAYPAEEARILSETKIGNFNPQEMFIHGDRLLLFGFAGYGLEPGPIEPKPLVETTARIMAEPGYYGYGGGFTSVRIYDISVRENPKHLRTVDFEGNYLTSRKIGSDVYFVVNSYPKYYLLEKQADCLNIMPLYRDTPVDKEPANEDMGPVAKCTDVGYVEPIQAEQFITVASISMEDENAEVKKEVIIGKGRNVYASLDSLYIAQTYWPVYSMLGELKEQQVEKTVITKFKMGEGNIEFVGTGEVNGNILNQFSMDEHNNYFRIATTLPGYENNKDTSVNNMYVLDSSLGIVGKVEGIAPGESIYSVRFMGDRAYMVTFKHVDPLFVLDLSNPESPAILGKLKIPGYSEYLHPYDETHIIGLGKEVDESIDADKVHTEGAVYYTAIQGVKLAIFDVSDVANPVELHKEVIGDRSTQSEAAANHKAFLFDKERNLLVIPITLAERRPDQDKSMEGEFTFQGAYVYDITLRDGFQLRGRVTHYDSDEEFKKSGYYFSGTSSIMRSLYIEDVLYTLSDKRLQLNNLDTLEKLKALDFFDSKENPEEG